MIAALVSTVAGSFGLSRAASQAALLGLLIAIIEGEI